MKTAVVPVAEIWRRLIEDRSVKVILPLERLQPLLVGLHKKRKSERDIFAKIGIFDEANFSAEDSIRTVRDTEYGNGGIDEDGNVCVTFLIAPRPKQTYTIILDETSESEDKNAAT